MNPPQPPDVPISDEYSERKASKSTLLGPVAILLLGFGLGISVGAAAVVLSRSAADEERESASARGGLRDASRL